MNRPIELTISKSDTPLHWQQQGYAIFRSLIAPGKIDRLLAEFKENIIPLGQALKRQPSFRRESGERKYPHAYDSAHTLTPEGYMKEGLKDPHTLMHVSPAFAGMTLDILCIPAVQEALASLDARYPEYTLHQSMLFDFNPGTDPHQDSYYIDSEPRGALLGLWLALEDIREEAGRFYVVAGSNLDAPSPDVFLHNANSEYLKILDAYFARNQQRIVAPDLRKGDALVWNCQVVHGSLPNQNPRYSRKSLTAHYVPQFLPGRNNARIFRSTMERTAYAMPYVITNRPDMEGRKIIEDKEYAPVIDGKEVHWQVIRTADGEQVVWRKRE